MGQNPELIKAWKERSKIRTKGRTLYIKGNKLCTKGDKLHTKGSKLWTEGDKLWTNAILAIHGNIGMKWKKDGCYLENGEIYKS